MFGLTISALWYGSMMRRYTQCHNLHIWVLSITA